MHGAHGLAWLCRCAGVSHRLTRPGESKGPEHGLSLLALNGLRVSETTGAGIAHLGLEHGAARIIDRHRLVSERDDLPGTGKAAAQDAVGCWTYM